jgi:hypothetical protein
MEGLLFYSNHKIENPFDSDDPADFDYNDTDSYCIDKKVHLTRRHCTFQANWQEPDFYLEPCDGSCEKSVLKIPKILEKKILPFLNGSKKLEEEIEL